MADPVLWHSIAASYFVFLSAMRTDSMDAVHLAGYFPSFRRAVRTGQIESRVAIQTYIDQHARIAVRILDGQSLDELSVLFVALGVDGDISVCVLRQEIHKNSLRIYDHMHRIGRNTGPKSRVLARRK